MNIRAICQALLSVVLLGCSGQGQQPLPGVPKVETFGRFIGNVDLRLNDDGFNSTLLADFGYVDPRGKQWKAPKDSVVNGASIPKAFWSIIGGPLEGKYRNASVVHDVACDQRVEPWEDVHLMFYEACRCGNLDESTAKLMYWAVYHFGPRWKKFDGVDDAVPNLPAPPSDSEVAKAREYFEGQKGVSLDTIRQLRFMTETDNPDSQPNEESPAGTSGSQGGSSDR